MEKTILQYLFIGVLVLIVGACASPKKIVYFQDDDGVELKDSILNFETTLEVGDELFINISATDSEAALPFNLYETPIITGAAFSNARPLSYLVSAEGTINFPVLGSLKVTGDTTAELTRKLKNQLIDHINDPIINIRLMNFKVSVLGEVNRPGAFPISDERVSILEAISMAGDLSIYGQRESVLLIREFKNSKEFITIDLTDKQLFNSPYYYLKQNDVIYVTPNKTKVNASAVGPNTGVIISSVSVLIALLAIIVK